MSLMIDGKPHKPEKVRFKYLKCTIQNQKQKTERRSGQDYGVSPHAIIIDSGNYYLLRIEEKSKKFRTYRIDRMSKARFIGKARDNDEETDNSRNILKAICNVYSRCTAAEEKT